MYNFGYRRAQSKAHRRICDERDRFKIADVEPPLVDYEPPDASAALDQVIELVPPMTSVRICGNFTNLGVSSAPDNLRSSVRTSRVLRVGESGSTSPDPKRSTGIYARTTFRRELKESMRDRQGRKCLLDTYPLRQLVAFQVSERTETAHVPTVTEETSASWNGTAE